MNHKPNLPSPGGETGQSCPIRQEEGVFHRRRQCLIPIRKRQPTHQRQAGNPRPLATAVVLVFVNRIVVQLVVQRGRRVPGSEGIQVRLFGKFYVTELVAKKG